MRRLAKRVLVALVGLLPTRLVEKLAVRLLRLKAESLPPDHALRLLFRVDADLYPLQGGLAVQYGGGVHTKHRHTAYHDFFVERVSTGERVLDIGCGNGALARDVAEKAQAKVVGVDFNQANIDKATRENAHADVRYRCGDALEELPAEGFDVVVLSNVLEHLPGRPGFLRRVQDEIKPSRILIRVPLFERDWRVPLRQELGVEWRLDETHETEYTPESFRAEIAEAGLRIDEMQIRWGEIWAEVRA